MERFVWSSIADIAAVMIALVIVIMDIIVMISISRDVTIYLTTAIVTITTELAVMVIAAIGNIVMNI